MAGKDSAIVWPRRGRRNRYGTESDFQVDISVREMSDVVVDPYRAVVFPNRIREQRMSRGHPKLFAFASAIPAIPYIRLSKLERGEVFARADELRKIAAALGMDPAELLLDIDAADFDIAAWFTPFADGTATDAPGEAEFAMLLGASMRYRRDTDRRLTAATMDSEFGIPPVILSRIENAQKGLSRWNDQTVQNLCRLFAVADEGALRSKVLADYKAGKLRQYLTAISSAEHRQARTRQRITALKYDLSQEAVSAKSSATVPGLPAARMVPVFGSPLANGLIAKTPTDHEIDAPLIAGPRAFALRVGRATLGGGLPGHATVIVDPDRFPQAGGLALIQEDEDLRIVAIAIGRDGQMVGYSTSPEFEVTIDAVAPSNISAIVSAIFV